MTKRRERHERDRKLWRKPHVSKQAEIRERSIATGIALGSGFGVGFGALVGVGMNNLALGVGTGLAVGVALGLSLGAMIGGREVAKVRESTRDDEPSNGGRR